MTADISDKSLRGKRVLLIISGGIAAYKSLILIRQLRDLGADVRCILTKGGAEFVTPLSVAALSENPVYTDLFSLKDESEMGHIRLSREADLVVVAPASADIIAKMACGMANDLATTCLLASDKPIMVVPAMNPQMWNNQATFCNIATLKARNAHILQPGNGLMACGEEGTGRMPEPDIIAQEIVSILTHKPLQGKRALVTAGPTYESIDPVRFIGNHSSGKQGYALAEALYALGAEVFLVSGPCGLPAPQGVLMDYVTCADEMLASCQQIMRESLDLVICAAAVSDWAPAAVQSSKIKKSGGAEPPVIRLKENPDILKTLSNTGNRPTLVVGFAAETDDVLENARAKLKRKGCDWIIANDVGSMGEPVFGSERNAVTIITKDSEDSLPYMSKRDIAASIAEKIAKELG